MARLIVVADRKERNLLDEGEWGPRTYSVEEKDVEDGL
jgi:hypothetical protein